MQNTIFLKDALEIMRTPDKDGRAIPFNISVRTFNRNTKKGGKLKTYENAKLLMNEKGFDKDSIQALKRLPKIKPTHRKNPQHFQNKTRNIKTPDGEKRKININFIIDFNGKKVIY